jgi:hypothetical protein
MSPQWSLAFLLAAACGSATATYSELKTRAAFDLKCDRANLKVTPLGDDVAGVEGCGQRATYVESCSDPRGNIYRNCSWVMDSSRRPAPTN